MKTRLIDDPGSLGWDYDPATGRWTWGGQGDGGSGGGGSSLHEAPVDGKQYGRQDASWTEVVAVEGGDGGDDPRITDTQITEWDASYGWGNHAGAGYLTSFNELDPTVPDHVKAITTTQISAWDAGTGGGGSGGNDPRISTTQIGNWDAAFGWGDHVSAGYATTTFVGQNYQAKGNYSLTNHNHNGVYQPAGSYAAVGASYTKAESDNKYEAKGGGGGAFVPLSGNSTIAGTLTATDFVATSDRNKKDNIQTASTGFIQQIRGVTFNWKDTGAEASGVVAQELQEVGLGHLVHEDDDGLKVSYNGLTAYLIEEVKALRAEVEALKR